VFKSELPKGKLSVTIELIETRSVGVLPEATTLTTGTGMAQSPTGALQPPQDRLKTPILTRLHPASAQIKQ
jgi:hypothetical protein